MGHSIILLYTKISRRLAAAVMCCLGAICLAVSCMPLPWLGWHVMHHIPYAHTIFIIAYAHMIISQLETFLKLQIKLTRVLSESKYQLS